MALAFMLLCLGSGTILLVPLAFRDLIDFGFGQRPSSTGGLMGSLSLNGHFSLLFVCGQYVGIGRVGPILYRKLDRRTGHGRFAQRGV